MKKILCIVLAALTLLSLVSCGGSLKKSDFGGKPVSLMPHYLGEGEDDPFYQFTEEDMSVTIIYSDSLTAEMTEGFKVTTTTDSGYYIIEVEWNGLTGDILIPIGKEKYQAYKAELEAKRAEIEAAKEEAAKKAAEIEASLQSAEDAQ